MATSTATSLTIAPTQSTAPVHESRCLYTRDLHKKSKKWHDGSVRFHTFNRRVMVYDDAHNFIGDLHYRQEEEFGEGTEIRLDRGILVEVGEPLGETQTDLAPILDRQRPEKGPTPQKSRISLATAQSQRPKSLLEVLGQSQGRLGRARLPYQSPYEHRYTSSRVEPAEPTAKRRRLSSDKENQSDGLHQPRASVRPGLPQPTQQNRQALVPPPSHRKEPQIDFEEVVELSPDDEPREPCSIPVKAIGNRTKINQDRQHKKQQTPAYNPQLKQIPTPAPAISAQNVEAKAKVKDKKNQQNPKISRTQIKPTTIEPRSKRQDPTRREARLLLALPKPRQKLTCILPYSDQPDGFPQPRKSALAKSAREEPLSTQPRDPTPTRDDDVVLPDLVLRLQAPLHEHESPMVIASSPLFVPEEVDPQRLPFSQSSLHEFEEDDPSQTLQNLHISQFSASPTKSKASASSQLESGNVHSSVEQVETSGIAVAEPQMEEDKAVHMCEEIGLPQETVVESEDQADDHLLALAGSQNHPRTTSETYQQIGIEQQSGAVESTNRQLKADTRSIKGHRPSSDSAPPLSKACHEKPTTTTEPVIPTRSATDQQARVFRRVLSENDALGATGHNLPSEFVASTSKRPLIPREIIPAGRVAAKVLSPSKIQRCASDTAAMTRDNHASNHAIETTKEPIGPWTIDEAFLLFDWWPAEVEKPAYWADTVPKVLPRALPEPVPSNWGGITTARQYLRDDINVL